MGSRATNCFLLGLMVTALSSCAAPQVVRDRYVAQGVQYAAAEYPDSIGVATMTSDGAIRLQLRAEGPGGAVGDAVLTYKLGDPSYEEVKRHVGPIEPGEEKPVPPWPTVR